jgi:hypothetical protein
MKKQVYIILALCILSISSVLGQKKVLLLNGFLHIGNEKTIETAAVGIFS